MRKENETANEAYIRKRWNISDLTQTINCDQNL